VDGGARRHECPMTQAAGTGGPMKDVRGLMVDILPAAASVGELPRLIVLGWYLTVMQRSDMAAVVDAGAG
jgi:hypothetical protein